MKYYGHRGYRNPNFIIPGRDTTGAERSIGCQYEDIAKDLAAHFGCIGFWRKKKPSPKTPEQPA